MKMMSDQPSEYLLRDKSPPIPKLKAERFLLATTALSMPLALLFVFFVFRETHGAVPHGEPTPLLGVIRLLLALPFLLLFGVVVGSSKGMPRVATLTLSSTAALLALRLVLEAAASYHGRVPNDEYIELFVNILMVTAILVTLYYGSRAARQSADRER